MVTLWQKRVEKDKQVLKGGRVNYFVENVNKKNLKFLFNRINK